jgi:hypothetical protein
MGRVVLTAALCAEKACTAGLCSRYTKAATPNPRFLKLRLLHKRSICINNGKPIKRFITTTRRSRYIFTDSDSTALLHGGLQSIVKDETTENEERHGRNYKY